MKAVTQRLAHNTHYCKRVLLLFWTPLLQKYSQIDTFVRIDTCDVCWTLAAGGIWTPPFWSPAPSYLHSTAVLRMAASGLGERATCLPHLDRPCFSQSALGGVAQLVSQVLGGGAYGTLQAPPLRLLRLWSGHWPQGLGAWPSWG